MVESRGKVPFACLKIFCSVSVDPGMLERKVDLIVFFEREEAMDFSSSRRRAHNLLFVRRIEGEPC